MDLLFKILYMASLVLAMSKQAFFSLSTVCSVYFTALFSRPYHSIVVCTGPGSEVFVYGTALASAAKIPPAICECFVDNISIGPFTPTSNNANNWLICGSKQLEDGPHFLSLKVNISALNFNRQTFWVDQIQYAPSANILLDQSLLRIDSTDPAIRYGPEWSQTSLFNFSPILSYNASTTTCSSGGSVSSFTYTFFGS